MSEFLKRYIETSLVAATLLIFAKILGVWIGLLATKASFSLVTAPELFTYISVNSIEQVQRITLIADSVFIGLGMVFCIFVLSKTLLFNDLTRHPRMMVKVIHYNLTSWLEDGQSMYPRLFAWATFMWLATILVVKDYLTISIPVAVPLTIGVFSVYYTIQVFSFLDAHISDMISYLYGEKRTHS